MAIPAVKVDVSGARGESLTDIARRTGAFGIDPTDSDSAALAKYGAGVALEAGVTAEADRAQDAANFAEGFSGPVYASQGAGEAATTEGQIFRVSNGDGPPETTTAYRRTSSGSVELAPLATTANLSSTEGAGLLGFKRSGGGAVARTVNEVLTDAEVSVKDYGAALDGVTDDAAAINAALAEHTRVLIPAGIALIGSPILVPSGRTLRGAGVNKTTIKLAANAECVIVSNEHGHQVGGTSADTDTNIHVSDFTIDGNRANQTNEGWWTGVEFTWVEDCSVERVSTRDTMGNGVGVYASRNVVVRQCRAENFGDDGFTATDVDLGGGRASRFITFEDCYAKTANKMSIVSFGSGFEADDGVRDVRFIRCTAEDCLVGFYADWSSLSGGASATGSLHYEDCTSIDADVGHFHFIGHYTKVLDNVRLVRCRTSGRPSNPSPTSGALSFSNGIWTNIVVDDFEAIDSGRVNLRGIHGGKISFKFSDALSRVDIGGEILTGGMETHAKDIEFPRVEITDASFVLFERMQNLNFGAVTLSGAAYLQLTNYAGVTIQRLNIVGSTNTSQSLLIGGQTGSQECDGLKILSGEIVGGAGHGIAVTPSAANITDTHLHLNVKRVQKTGLRLTTGSGGMVEWFHMYGNVEDACLNASGSTNQIDVGSTTSSKISNAYFYGKIKRVLQSSPPAYDSIAARGIAIISAAAGISRIFYVNGDIAGAGATSNYFDVDSKITWINTLGGA